MCANFQPITLSQAKLFTSQQLCFEFKDRYWSEKYAEVK